MGNRQVHVYQRQNPNTLKQIQRLRHQMAYNLGQPVPQKYQQRQYQDSSSYYQQTRPTQFVSNNYGNNRPQQLYQSSNLPVREYPIQNTNKYPQSNITSYHPQPNNFVYQNPQIYHQPVQKPPKSPENYFYQHQAQSYQKDIQYSHKQQEYQQQIQYNNSPDQLQQLYELRRILQECKDPKKMAEIVLKLKKLFWQNLRKQQFTTLPGKSVIFIGRTSSGKSSLLNNLFDLKLKTSKASCTKTMENIKTFNSVSVFDCPGLDQYFDLVKKPEKIVEYLGQMSDIYYLYDGFIEDDIINTLLAMRKNFYLVRTKCDPDDNPGENDDVKRKDIGLLTKIVGNQGNKIQIFLTSKFGGADNQKLLEHIKKE